MNTKYFLTIFTATFLLVCNAFAQKKATKPILIPRNSAVSISNYDENCKYQYAFNPFLKQNISFMSHGEVLGDRIFVRALTNTDTSEWVVGYSNEFKKLSKPTKKMMVYYCGDSSKDDYKPFKNAMQGFFKKINWKENADYSIEFIDPNNLSTFQFETAQTVLFYANKANIKSYGTKDATMKNKIISSFVSKKLLAINYNRILVIFDTIKDTKTKGTGEYFPPIAMDTVFTGVTMPSICTADYFAYIPYERNADKCSDPFYKKLFMLTDERQQKYLLLDPEFSTIDAFMKKVAHDCCHSENNIKNNIVKFPPKSR